MIKLTNLQDAFARCRQFFKTRDFIFHDGRDLRRFSIAGRTQAAVAVAGELWLGDRAGEPPPSRLDGGPVTVVIGPEGGLTIVEREAVLAARASPVVLGPHTLRFETAALAAAAAVAAARLRGTHG